MDKLGYTFYPKDWWTSDTFFKLPPELRYLYLEIISMMYVNDGVWKANRMELHKRFGVDPMEKGWEVLRALFQVDGDIWSHPSVNKRLRKTIANRENGKLGGRPKTQITQENNPQKPTLEREGEREIQKESKGEFEREFLADWVSWGRLIVSDSDHVWHNMKGRKVLQNEMNSFLSVAARNDWKMETQTVFRLTLNGFDLSKFDKQTPKRKNLDGL